MSLINNPLGELLGPVNRLETAVGELGERISAVDTLPRIEQELAETREATLELRDAVCGIRSDLAELTALLNRAVAEAETGRTTA